MRLPEFRLAARLAARQWRAGDLWLLLGAATLAVAITTLVAALGDRLERGLVRRAADLLGADLVLAGSRPAAPAALAVAPRHGLAATQATDFSTLLLVPGSALDDRVLLVAVRAVDGSYPLRGNLRIRDAAGERELQHGPPPGELWIEPRVAEELGGLAPGARVAVGERTLQVTAMLLREPDRAADFSALSPRVLMHADDLAAAGVIQPGSRVRYRTLFAGTPVAVAAARQALEAMRGVDEEVLDVRTGSRRTASALARTLQFVALASILGVLLCGATLALVADRHARRLYDTVALLRTFGLDRRTVRRVLLLEVLGIALVAGTLGVALGLLAQSILAGLLASLLPEHLPPPGLAAAGAGFACALIALPAFLLPALARLAAVSPLRVLRRDLAPPSAGTALQYALGLALLAALLVATAGDRELALALLAGVAALLVIGVPLAARAISALARRRERLPLATRLAADRLAHTPWRSGTQLIAFALIFTTLALATLLRNDLFSGWQRQLPANAPNLFAMNLLPHEHEAFLATLAAHGVAPPVLYPVTPGRLVRIGDTPLAERIAADSDTARALDRDLVLTVGTTGATETTRGEAFTATTPPGQVSVEEELAGKLGLQPGDRLTFVVAGEEITAQVAGLRRVEWDSFRPNFYMILSPGSLPDAPYTGLTSFYASDTATLLPVLRRAFPAITVIEVGPLLTRLGEFVGALAAGVQFVATLLLVAALLLLAASVYASLDERRGEAALLRVLGARHRLLRRTLAAEFALLGAGSGLVAAGATELARLLVYTRVMDLPWQPLPLLFLLPAAAALLLAGLGVGIAGRSLRTPAGTLLRDT